MRVLVAFGLGVMVGAFGVLGTIDRLQDGAEAVRVGVCSTTAVDCVR